LEEQYLEQIAALGLETLFSLCHFKMNPLFQALGMTIGITLKALKNPFDENIFNSEFRKLSTHHEKRKSLTSWSDRTEISKR